MKSFGKLSLFGRMTWVLSLLSIVTLGVCLATIAFVLERYQLHQFDQDLLSVARQEAREAETNAFSFTARPGPASSDVGPLENYGVMYDEGGRPLSATPPFLQQKPVLSDYPDELDTPFDFVFGREHLRGVVVAIPGYPGRRLLLSASRQELRRDGEFVRHALAIAFAVSILWMSANIAWLLRRTAKQHARVVETLRRVAAGDVNARVEGGISDEELRQLGSDIDEIAHRLAILLEQQRRFVVHAAHELRSPLSALLVEVQQALRKERSPEEYRQALSLALKATRRLKQLADDLLELAKSDASRDAPTEVPLRVLLDGITEGVRALMLEKNVSVEVKGSASMFAVPGDLERVFRNLIDNAIRHSPSGGTIEVAIQAGDPNVVRVRDQGDGVPSVERERIFEPFYRARGTRSDAQGGAGLGLAIARELARRWGGDVVVAESLGVDEGEGEGTRGACFVVTLPMSPPGSPPPSTVEQAPVLAASPQLAKQ